MTLSIYNFYFKDHVRGYLKNHNGKTYASDGCFVVESPLCGEFGNPSEELASELEKAFEWDASLEFKPLSDFLGQVNSSLPPPIPCCICEGTGIVCAECFGDGEVVLKTEFNWYGLAECRSCNNTITSQKPGNRSVVCQHCHGTRLNSNLYATVMVGHVPIQYYRFQMINDENVLVAGSADGEYLMFVQGELRGLIRRGSKKSFEELKRIRKLRRTANGS